MINPEIIKRVESNFDWDKRTYISVDKNDLGPILAAAKKGAEMEEWLKEKAVHTLDCSGTRYFGYESLEHGREPTTEEVMQHCDCGLSKILEKP